MTLAYKQAYMHTMCLHGKAHIMSKFGWIREIKVSMESGEHAGPFGSKNVTQSHKLACMHTICLRASAHISAKLGWIIMMKVSMESGEHAGPL